MSERSEIDLGLDRPPSRFIVGIDLGTTNCAVAYIDTHSSHKQVRLFPVEQLVDWSTHERRDTLPSFHYQLTGQEVASLDQNNGPRFGASTKGRRTATPSTRPSDRSDTGNTDTTTSKSEDSAAEPVSVVGAWARDRGMQLPGRQIASAKSWLCHAGVDRTAAILPWHGDEDVEKLSPVQASSRYLEHIRRVWNRHHPRDPLADQDVVITLPASFDEVARELTIEAAKLAGLPRIFLVEEPQAAFYAWLSRHGDDWHSTILPGQSILVCDIGGGTTDFTLIRVRTLESEASQADATLHRVAVGQHVILGGDNLDLALAQAAEAQLMRGNTVLQKGEDTSNDSTSNNNPTSESPSINSTASQSRVKRLSPREFDTLRMNCRLAKEILLGDRPPEQHTIALPASGSRLIGGARNITIDQSLVRSVLLDGFFAPVALTDKPGRQTTGFQEFGLPYASDPVITRHLAEFLWEHRWDGRDDSERAQLAETTAARPDWILFNGGVLEAKQIRDVLLNQIQQWFAGRDEQTLEDWRIGVLEGNRLDLAVAWGAAYFGLVRRGEGVRIDANLARSYYLTISEEPPRAVCLVPGNARAGDRFSLTQQPFELAIGQPVQFPLWTSSLQLVDAPGEIIDIDEDRMRAMPPIRTVLEIPKSRKQATLPVFIEAELTEIGTLSLACVSLDRAHRWKLDFDIRAAVETDRSEHQGEAEASGFVEQSIIDAATSTIASVFGPDGNEDPKRLQEMLAAAIGRKRNDWPSSLLRSMWQSLITLEDGRKKSAAHEARWINLLGFCLRPGYGFAADDWRVATTWRKVQGKIQFPSVANLSEAIILWRRIAGGFTAGQQQALYQEIGPRVRNLLSSDGKPSNVIAGTNEAIELLRLVGSLEWLNAHDKALLGTTCLKALRRKKLTALHPATLWTIGRLGSRVPVYGPLNALVSIDHAAQWIEELIQDRSNLQDRTLQDRTLAVMQLARRTGDRYRDIPDALRERVVRWMTDNGSPASYLEAVREVSTLDAREQAAIIGESLPLGIRMSDTAPAGP